MKKSIIIAMACTLVTGAALIGTVNVFAGTGSTEQPVKSDTEVSEEAQNTYVRFSPTARITGDIKAVAETSQKQEKEEFTRIIVEKFGYDPRTREETLDKDTFSELCKMGVKFENDKTYSIFEKMSEAGYGDSGKDIIYTDGSFDLEKDVTRSCDLVIMVSNAYNDPNYEISDTDRIRVLNFLDGACTTLSGYGVKGKENGKLIMSVDTIPEEVTVAMDIAAKTYAAEYGSYPLFYNE